jgi:two-component system, cell cycle response regulator
VSARILVVDDVEMNVKLLEAKLASEYFNVITANDGFAALQKLHDEKPDIVLLDVMMPGLDGFEVCRRMKADPLTAEVPVVMVTALSDRSDRVRGLEAGADDFLTKPVNDMALFARVRSLVRLRRMMEEWRHREEVYGRFEPLLGAARPSERQGPARVILWGESAFSAGRIIEMLKPIANEVVRCETPDEVQAACDGTIDLTILSLAAKVDALRVVAQLRAHETSRHVPILLLADAEELPRLAKGLDLGANDYLIRPLDPNELIARARTQARRKRLQDQLLENYQKSLSLALTDTLTGLYNRRFLAAHLDGLVARAAQGAMGPALIIFDIDWFKRVNDSWGHPGGDAVLREVAQRAVRNVRAFDLTARYGGEEFVVVLPETPLAVALIVAERLRSTIAETPIVVTDPPFAARVTISAGVAATRPGETSQSLLQRADSALYAAKTGGRNRVVNAEEEKPEPAAPVPALAAT